MKRLSSNITLAWAVALFIVPLPLLATLAAGLPPLYSNALFGAEIGVIAYTWMLAAVYLACRPRWVDRTVGLPHMYMIHGILGVLAIALACMHQALLPGAGALIGATGHLGLYLFIAIGVWSMVFLGGLAAQVPWIAAVRHSLEKLFRHEMSVWLHRLNMVAIALIALHVHVIDYIASIKPFIFLFDAMTIIVFAYYLWTSINRRAFALRGHVASVRPLADRISELRISFTGKNAARVRWNAGDFAFIAFPGERGMHEYHPFSLTNAYAGGDSGRRSSHADAPTMSFAIRADGDFTSRIASLKPGVPVRVVPPYGRYAEFISEHDARLRGHDAQGGKAGKYGTDGGPDDSTPLVLIGGGIGITPLLGVLRTYAGNGRSVDFLYTARTERDFIYRSELERIGETSSNTRVRLSTDRPNVATIVPMIRPHAIYLVAGPHAMMVAVRKILSAHGVAASDIYYEPFAM